MPRRAGWPGSLVSRTLLRSVCADSFGPSSRGRMSELWVGPAQSSDLVTVAAIYHHWLRTSTATFDVMQPPLSWRQAKLDSTAAGDHFLVVRDDDAVLGFAYSGAFRTRPAYALTRETSVYLARQAMGRGAGSRLYSELLWLLRHDHVHLVVAVVAQPNPPACHPSRPGLYRGGHVGPGWVQLRRICQHHVAPTAPELTQNSSQTVSHPHRRRRHVTDTGPCSPPPLWSDLARCRPCR